MKRLIDGADLAGKLRTRKANAIGHTEAMDAYETAMNDAIDAEEITLNTLRDEVYEDAVAHGLWDEGFDIEKTTRECMERVADEMVELLEEGKRVVACASIGADKKTREAVERFEEELADVIIMSLSVAGKLGIDIDWAIREKMAINRHRPWKHEGEKHESNPD